jgi:hypothetical protein
MLVVSDPPHGKVDHQAVADVLGLDVTDTSPKIGFGAPEVLRPSDEARAVPFAHLLNDAGLRVAVIDGEDLARVPWPAPLASLTFGTEGLVGEFREAGVIVRYDQPVLAMYCKPPAGYKRPETPRLTPWATGLAIAEAIDGMTILDLFYERDGALARASIVEGVTDFAAPGRVQGASPGGSLAAVLDECRGRFARMHVDARLENVRPRRRFVAGEAGFDIDLRKHYSFGTLLLRHVLASISPDLKDLPHYEYGARLGCAMARPQLS